MTTSIQGGPYPSGYDDEDRLRFSKIEENICEALSPDLRTIFLGSIMSLRDGQNPDRLALAAHGIRELMEKWSRLSIERETEAKGDLHSKSKEFLVEWERVQRGDGFPENLIQAGRMSNALVRFIERCGAFFDWVKNNRPARKKTFARLLQKMDARGIPLPPFLEDMNIQIWSKYWDYFTSVSHHRGTDEKEFEDHLVSFEHFLVDRLKPRVFDEIVGIEQIIRDAGKR